MRHSGSCHCGAITIVFETRKDPAALGVRACQCGFCRRHGALTTSDANGAARVEASARDLIRYRFGFMTCDFLICARCGVYAAAAIGEGQGIRATLNVAGLAMADFATLAPTLVDYSAETEALRSDRRGRLWTPTQFADENLAAAKFGTAE